ncbi:hypothetical protein EN828_23675 [Mesorhizobium sp. M2D.F.Ca.ET.185.01.1.1]|nr:hypothetical protein EN783_24905 [Mesorhizobium sp. M2D.F.Ca.ET.140.01.1.1]TGP13607.1 hypothetical protein EN876_30875 [Mesorhizobium sp. M2D.F.Ca.ET.233.01.1.1]TGP28643.1 hypothetical protein EN875_031145 [Mesorhizobium sp. M2D.F.Ca.ET.232.01.1.1]TGP56256.1 hypothetical protein EN869_022345 [Mesorhizobium sp. M2D.F.Ca.ET.226.01.1.1]TGP65915.1 hypothetical protein EN868_24095 [Mesorhizobium sp. M2D.F.Ca.ET.225.01.1.1]TGP71341.1 hypothetical protein EN867_27120 [Mesorhizobium sp. M2D.F.Ca.ET
MMETSATLETRVAGLQDRLKEAKLSMDDMLAFQKVADVLDNGHGGIDIDDLIALSFVVEEG